MSAPTPAPDLSDSKSVPSSPTPVRCFVGALVASPIAYGLYLLTSAIATTFAEKPLSTSNMLAANISVMVRTLVVGLCTLGTGIFAITTLGLVALGIQLLFKKAPVTQDPGTSSESTDYQGTLKS